MDAFDRLKATTWDEAKDFVDIGYVSMSSEMNAVTQSVEIEAEQPFDILEILSGKAKGHKEKGETVRSRNDLNMDDKSFNPQKYLAIMHDKTSFNLLVNGPLRLESKINHKNKEIMRLVESHFDQFINCKDTLDKMKMIINAARVDAEKDKCYLKVVIQMQEKYQKLLESLANIKKLTDLKKSVEDAREAIGVIERARSVFSLPAQLRAAETSRDDDRFVNIFNRAQGLSKETDITIYEDVLKDCNTIGQRFVDSLFDEISSLDLQRNKYDRSLTTLFEMKQFASIVLRDNPVIYLLRSHRETLRSMYEEKLKEMSEFVDNKNGQNQKKLMHSLHSLGVSKTAKTYGNTSLTMTMVVTDDVTDPNVILAKSTKYQAFHGFCEKMISHISILLGIMNFSSNKQTEEDAEEESEVRKTTLLFEDKTVVSVSYSKNTTMANFLKTALDTYKMKNPKAELKKSYEICSFIGKTSETNESVLAEALRKAIPCGEKDTPFELESRWTTASKEISHGFYVREKQVGLNDQESTSDRKTYVIKIIKDFCKSMTTFFKTQPIHSGFGELQNKARVNNIVDKACLEDIDKVKKAFYAQAVEKDLINPIIQTHSELVKIFIETIMSQTKSKIVNLLNKEEIYLNTDNGILKAFQKVYFEDFKMLRDIVEETDDKLDQIMKFLKESINALIQMFTEASNACDSALTTQSERARKQEEVYEEAEIEYNDYTHLTQQRKLLSLSENAQNAFRSQIAWELYTASILSKDDSEVVEKNDELKQIVLPFDQLSTDILKFYTETQRESFKSMLGAIDAADFKVWVNEDIEYKTVDEYALNILSELVMIKQDLHIYAMSKESQCMGIVLINLLQEIKEFAANAKSPDAVEKDIEESDRDRVCLRWLMGAEFLVECCKYSIQNNSDVMDQVKQILNEMKDIIGDEAIATEEKRKATIETTMKWYEPLICSFKLNALNDEKMGKVTKNERRGHGHMRDFAFELV